MKTRTRSTRQGSSIFDLANSRMTIATACTLAGMDVDEHYTGKLYCPFGEIFHLDGGSSKAFRVYSGDNSAWCFAGCGYFTPVRMVAKVKDFSDAEAAQWILDQTNYVPPDYESQWAALMAAPVLVDTDGLSAALMVSCARVDPRWEDRQFDPDIAASLRRCLEMLPKVKTPDDATQWLSVTKQFMHRALGDSSE